MAGYSSAIAGSLVRLILIVAIMAAIIGWSVGHVMAPTATPVVVVAP